MTESSLDTNPGSYIVESFYNDDPPGQRCCKSHHEFATADAALKCACRLMDKSLKRTRLAASSSVEWYRHWATCGVSVVVPGTGFESRAYAKLRIRTIMGPWTAEPINGARQPHRK